MSEKDEPPHVKLRLTVTSNPEPLHEIPCPVCRGTGRIDARHRRPEPKPTAAKAAVVKETLDWWTKAERAAAVFDSYPRGRHRTTMAAHFRENGLALAAVREMMDIRLWMLEKLDPDVREWVRGLPFVKARELPFYVDNSNAAERREQIAGLTTNELGALLRTLPGKNPYG